jgi:hypothetical protein
MRNSLIVMTCLAAGVVVPNRAQDKQPTATFDKPTKQVVSGGMCRSDGKGTFGATFPSTPDAKKPYLAFSIGPATFMAKESGASTAPFHGPGTYSDVLTTGNAGALFSGLATITVGPDGRSGTFALKDGGASGSWDCCVPPR